VDGVSFLCSGTFDEAESEPKFKSEPWVDCKVKGILIDGIFPEVKSSPRSTGAATIGSLKESLNQVSNKLKPTQPPNPPANINCMIF
jgi:hypothetical protein